jgi:signal transduction histidine kinase
LHQTRDGRRVVIEYSMIPLLGPEGRLTGFVTANRDITLRKQAEEEALSRGVQIELQRRLLEQREMERMDIARDLHDGPLQELTAISFDLSAALDLDEKTERQALLKRAQHMLLKQSADLRAFCNELRPPALAPFGLEKAIRSHMDHYQDRHPHLKVHLNLVADKQTLPEHTRMALFRIYQEVINNLTKHAKASEVWVSLRFQDDSVILEIVDNGQGFTVPQDWVKQARSGHLGLIGMRERAQAINGRIAFISQPGAGATVRITAPKK